MSVELSTATLSQFALCDANLRGLQWIENGRDLRLEFVDGSGRFVELTCGWVRALRIELTTASNELGLCLTWECVVVSLESGWRLRIEFPSNGVIEFECNDAILDVRAVA